MRASARRAYLTIENTVYYYSVILCDVFHDRIRGLSFASYQILVRYERRMSCVNWQITISPTFPFCNPVTTVIF